MIPINIRREICLILMETGIQKCVPNILTKGNIIKPLHANLVQLNIFALKEKRTPDRKE